MLMITGGLFAVGGQVCLTKSLSAERVGPVAILRSTNVIASFAFQSLVTPMDPISSWSILGATCIVLSIAMILVGKGRHRGVKAVVGGGTSTTKPSEATYSVACESSPAPKADKQNKRYLGLGSCDESFVRSEDLHTREELEILSEKIPLEALSATSSAAKSRIDSASVGNYATSQSVQA